ncbi:hypothetical protein WN51_12186 [Melipona quadrifasciata]|uniref:Uncharacterized protein n=1 Tax=Melipona quadrifasciata TaxID=166423 RepID=A0A0N0BGX5_9HYME|nr:hypothetical protein WN51_12186 [Melipona quadrifasciata]
MRRVHQSKSVVIKRYEYMLLTSFLATLQLMSLASHVRIIKQSTANEKTWGLLDALVNFTLQVIPVSSPRPP